MSEFKPTPAQSCAMDLTGRDILVSAAAGSGKTATLTQRIINSLVNPNEDERGDISRMLIVTFTRAAAAELRSRISAELSRVIAAGDSDGAPRADRAYLHKQLLSLGSAQICTIDSFYQQTVRANFERLGLPAAFRLADEVELAPLKEQILDRLIDHHYASSAKAEPDPDAPLDQLSGNAFALAMDNLLANRDRGDTANVLLTLFNKLLSFPEELELLQKGADRLSRQLALPLTQTDEGRVVVEHLLQRLSAIRAKLADAIEQWHLDTYTETNYVPAAAEDLNTIDQIIADLLAGLWDSARERAQNYTPIGFGQKGKKNPDPPFDADALVAIRKNAKDTLTELAKGEMEYSEEEYRARMLRTATTQRMLYALLSDYDRTVTEEKKRRGMLEFSDIRRYMLRLLEDENGNATDVARSLASRFDAVYIDEYQDVDAVQDRIFALVGAGGKRFMVGDIKQSIYAFRGSDPSLFAGYRKVFPTVKTVDDPALSPSGNCIFMSENFRCDETVIDATNSICGYIFEACPDSLAYHAEEDDLTFAKKVNEGYLPTPVQLTVLETPSARVKDTDPKTALRAEAVAIAEEIVRLLHSGKTLANGQPIRAGDIAVLMRSMGMAGDLVKALRAYNIDSSYAPRENLAAHPHMTMMVDLLSVIDNPHDDVPLMGLFGCEGSPIPLTDVLSARGETKKSSSLYDDLCAAAEDGSSVAWSEDTRRAMRSFCEHLARWRALAATLPVDRLLRKLYTEPFLAPLINTPALVALYDHARNYQNASFCGLYQFLQYFRRLLDSPDGLSIAGLKENNDAVQIMSIHKSKGLEFPVVFVCNCSKKFNERDQKATIIFDRHLGAATQLFNPDTAAQESSLTRRAIAHCIDERATEEEMRLLYVAMTRARERLYLTAQLSQSHFDTVRKRAATPTRGNRYATLSVNNYLDWILSGIYAPDATIPEDRVKLTVLNKDLYTHPHPIGEVLASSLLTETVDETEPTKVTTAASADEQFYRAILARHASYVDPRALLRTLPTKAAASKLRVAMLDGRWLAEEFGGDAEGAKARTEETVLSDTETSIRRRIELMQGRRPAFDELLAEGERATPAERGTATHLFLQYCDVKRLARIGVEGEITRLVEDGFLTKRAADALRRDQLDAFRASDLFTLLTKPDVRVWRELHFDRFIPYRTLTRDAALAERLEDYTLYVQGSIDLLVEESDGTLWLFDYKTDRIRDGGEEGVREQLLGDHADQLRIYAEAVGGLFGRRPDHISIYSLPLGQSVELTPYL